MLEAVSGPACWSHWGLWALSIPVPSAPMSRSCPSRPPPPPTPSPALPWQCWGQLACPVALATGTTACLASGILPGVCPHGPRREGEVRDDGGVVSASPPRPKAGWRLWVPVLPGRSAAGGRGGAWEPCGAGTRGPGEPGGGGW